MLCHSRWLHKNYRTMFGRCTRHLDAGQRRHQSRRWAPTCRSRTATPGSTATSSPARAVPLGDQTDPPRPVEACSSSGHPTTSRSSAAPRPGPGLELPELPAQLADPQPKPLRRAHSPYVPEFLLLHRRRLLPAPATTQNWHLVHSAAKGAPIASLPRLAETVFTELSCRSLHRPGCTARGPADRELIFRQGGERVHSYGWAGWGVGCALIAGSAMSGDVLRRAQLCGNTRDQSAGPALPR